MMMLLEPAVWWIISTSNLAMVTPPEEIRRWTTPLFSADISTALPLDAPHLLDTLESSLAALRSAPREALGVRKSNRDGGWHSNELLAPEMYSEFGGPGSLSLLCAVADLHDALVDAVERTPLRRPSASDVLVQNMWANANGASHTNVVHNHPDAAISGVLYLNTAAAELSEDTLSGVLALADPRLAPQCAGSGDPNVPSPAQVLRRKSLFMLCAWCDGDQLNQCSSSLAGELATTLRPGYVAVHSLSRALFTLFLSHTLPLSHSLTTPLAVQHWRTQRRYDHAIAWFALPLARFPPTLRAGASKSLCRTSLHFV